MMNEIEHVTTISLFFSLTRGIKFAPSFVHSRWVKVIVLHAIISACLRVCTCSDTPIATWCVFSTQSSLEKAQKFPPKDLAFFKKLVSEPKLPVVCLQTSTQHENCDLPRGRLFLTEQREFSVVFKKNYPPW